MFYFITASALHETLDSPSGLPALLAAAFLASGIALWVLADARQRQRSIPYDFGSFVFFTWPLLVPIYLFSTRGWRAFAPIGCFILIYLAAALAGSIPLMIHSMRQ
jgi:hypothetical protein